MPTQSAPRSAVVTLAASLRIAASSGASRRRRQKSCNAASCPALRARWSKDRAFSIDRKSTRLNSSHGYISYAVFCLKKKKKKQQHIRREDKHKRPQKATETVRRPL